MGGEWRYKSADVGEAVDVGQPSGRRRCEAIDGQACVPRVDRFIEKDSRLTRSHDLSQAVGLQRSAAAAILEMVVVPAFGRAGCTWDIVRAVRFNGD